MFYTNATIIQQMELLSKFRNLVFLDDDFLYF